MTKLDKANNYQSKYKVPSEEQPVFHVAPQVGWMNDPNGFSVYQGKVHLFYQYHPYSDVWGPMHWGHCTTKDFIKWENMPIALAPDQEYDMAGCFSGSAVETEAGHVLVYTGVSEQEQEDGSRKVYQNQCVAVGDGITYRKMDGNPVLDGNMLPEGFSRTDFRDPRIWKEDGRYYLAAGNRNSNGNGQIVLFQSDNLRQWQYVSVLADNEGHYGTMWECPDFFELDGRHLLVVSPQDMRAEGYEFHNGNNSVCFIGEYDKSRYQFHHRPAVSLDYGLDFYAPQTVLAEDGRRILIGWMQSWDANLKPAEQRWNGMMTIPREMRLVDGVLCQNPVRELDNYHVAPIVCRNQEISGKCRIEGIEGRVLDLTVELLEGEYDKFQIHFAHNKQYTSVFTYYRDVEILEFDRTYSGVVRDVVCQRKMKVKDPKDTLKLRLVLDKYSVELFVNDGKQTFSAVIYTPPEAKDIIFECDGKVLANIEKYDVQIN